MMDFSILTDKWCHLSDDASVVIVTDIGQSLLANAIAGGMRHPCRIIYSEDALHPDHGFMSEIQALAPHDLVIALFSFDTFVQKGANRFFSPFGKPEGVAARYAFIRLGITEASLLQGLSTPNACVYEKIAEMNRYVPGSKLRVTNAAGTDITLTVNGFTTCRHEIIEDGGMAFLPPSETSAEVVPYTANGKIVVDVTVGQLYHYHEFLGYFGRVAEPTVLTVENGTVVDITGDDLASLLKEKLFTLPTETREVVELGQGLSQMAPTGLIGVDESILDTCHFGLGDAGKCGVHLDVVISAPDIGMAGPCIIK